METEQERKTRGHREVESLQQENKRSRQCVCEEERIKNGSEAGRKGQRT